MADAFRLYGRYIAVSIRSQMQYRASFVMLSLGQFMATGIEFIGTLALFDRFGHLQGWRLEEVALFYGLISISFAFADATSRGFDVFSSMVKSGNFDRLLLRPRHTVLQLAGQELTLRRIGRFSQGLLVILWASHTLDLEWTATRYLLLSIAILGGVCFFYALMVVQATFSFWTTEGLEFMNTLTYGGVEAGRYPLTIYRSWFRRFFTYVIPLACISYYPAIGILGRSDPLGSTLYFQWAAPGIGFVFFLASLQLWKFGVRHYRSTGS